VADIALDFLFLTEYMPLLVALALFLSGGVAGAFIFSVKAGFGRDAYFCFLASLNFAFMLFHLGWRVFLSADEASILSGLVYINAAVIFFLGAGLYYGSAARSNDIGGGVGLAWLGFVPIANLWLVFRIGAAGTGHGRQPRSRLDGAKPPSGLKRFFGEPPLVFCGVFLIFVAYILRKAFGAALM
jgi:hypothetical protein